MSGVRVAAVVLLVAALTACSTPSNKPPTSQQDAPGANVTQVKPTAKPSATATADPNVMFTISATVTSPAGAVADIVQVVYKPVAQDADSALLTDPDNGCGDWQSVIPDPEYVVTVATATDRSPAGVSWPDFGVAFVGLLGRPIFTGPHQLWGVACTDAIIPIGSVRGITAVSSGPADTGFGWANVSYGITTGGAAQEYEGWDDENITNCKISLSQWAIDNSAKAASWATQAQLYPGVFCEFGEENPDYPIPEY
jgi:hypothetical protein